MLLLYLAKWNMLLAVTQQLQKGTKFNTKSRSLFLVHIVELSMAVVKVDIKLINANLTQNQCLQCVPPLLRYCDCAPPLNWTMTAWSSLSTSTTKQNRIYQFFPKRFNQRRLQFLFAYSFSNWLAVSCFSFWKAFVKCSSLSLNGILMTSAMTSSPCNVFAVMA